MLASSSASSASVAGVLRTLVGERASCSKLNQALERGVGDARGIEAGSFGARAIGTAAVQCIEPIAGLDQKCADFGAG
jgi:hypothetical protein